MVSCVCMLCVLCVCVTFCCWINVFMFANKTSLFLVLCLRRTLISAKLSTRVTTKTTETESAKKAAAVTQRQQKLVMWGEKKRKKKRYAGNPTDLLNILMYNKFDLIWNGPAHCITHGCYALTKTIDEMKYSTFIHLFVCVRALSSSSSPSQKCVCVWASVFFERSFILFA